jgi:hypothetical protein
MDYGDDDDAAQQPMEIDGDEEMMNAEDIPVNQEDAWAVIRYESYPKLLRDSHVLL